MGNEACLRRHQIKIAADHVWFEFVASVGLIEKFLDWVVQLRSEPAVKLTRLRLGCNEGARSLQELKIYLLHLTLLIVDVLRDFLALHHVDESEDDSDDILLILRSFLRESDVDTHAAKVSLTAQLRVSEDTRG